VVDAEFAVVSGKGRIPPLEELKERLIAETFEALRHELLSREAAVAGSGALASAKAKVLEAIEWAMLGTAYAVDAVTSRTAIGTFLPGDASWLYGLVGPVLIGGIGSLAKERADKAVAFGLMASWALFVGLVTASDETYLSGAQAWFPKGETVRAHELLDAGGARLPWRKVSRQAMRGVNVTAVAMLRRWQAQIRKAAEAENGKGQRPWRRRKRTQRAAARTVRESRLGRRAGGFITVDAWRALFAIFTIINFAGPYGISRAWPMARACVRKG
jgi:hypothetical protein